MGAFNSLTAMSSTGLFDMQVNGFAGVDFQREGLTLSGLQRAAQGLAAAGCPRFFPTLITDAIESLERKFANFEMLRTQDEALARAIPGYHLEGPWLCPEEGYRGAHDAAFMGPPSLKDFQRLQKAAGGRIRLVTLAPEWPGSAGFIRELRRQGTHVSLGHTSAGWVEIHDAVEAGARFCTHLGNGVPATLHRHDNVIQRLLSVDELTAFFIPDGIHIPPGTLKNFFRAKPPGKALFTTDCMAAAGAPPGRYTIGASELEVGDDRVVRKPGANNFAGSALTPQEGVANLSRWLELSESEARQLFGSAVAAALGV